MNEQQPQNQLNIELPQEVAHGIYSNLVIISHSNSEFVFDFVQILPGTPKAEVRSRIIMTPYHAKRLMFALEDNIDKFEDTFGDIPVPDMDNNLPPTSFGGPAGIA